MPFYEYQCTNCDHRLEALQKISDEPLVYCPKCNEPSLKKLISAAAFRLKGTGWYETDFKNNGKKKEEKGGERKANESKSDSKSAPSTGSAPSSGSASKSSSQSASA